MIDLKAQLQLLETASRDGVDTAIRDHGSQLKVVDAEGLRSLSSDDLDRLRGVVQRVLDSGVEPAAVQPLCDNTFC